MRAIAIVQARLGSRRFPRKILATLGQQTVLEHVCQRALLIPGIDHVVVACPEADGVELDAILKNTEMPPEMTREGNVLHWNRARLVLVPWPGREADVLGRYHAVASMAEPRADVIVRLTGDDPLIDPSLCGEVLHSLLTDRADYASNIEPRVWPDGLDCEAITVGTLGYLDRVVLAPEDREHVTTYLRRRPRVFVIAKPVQGPTPPLDHLRWTVDTPDDLAYLTRLYPLIPPGETSWLATLKAAQALEARG